MEGGAKKDEEEEKGRSYGVHKLFRALAPR